MVSFRIGLFFAALLSLINIVVTAVATALDVQIAEYFSATIKQCKTSGDCYCAATAHQYDMIFEHIGSIKCNNVFTRNPHYLIANAVLSAICLVIALLFCLLIFGSFVRALCTSMCCPHNSADAAQHHNAPSRNHSSAPPATATTGAHEQYYQQGSVQANVV